MQRILWSEKACNREAFHRAGGRRRYNAMRKLGASARQIMLLKMCGNGYFRLFIERGFQAEMARELGVSKATISRDISLIRSVYTPLCRNLIPGHLIIPTVEQVIQALKERTGFTKMERNLPRETRSEAEIVWVNIEKI